MRFGIATCDITPPFATSMGGYGKRDDLFDDVHDPLSFTAVVLEQGDRRAMLGAADLLSFPNDDRTPALLDRLAHHLQTTPQCIMLNASHTHGGPKLPGTNLFSRSGGDMALAERYADWLADRVVQTAQQAAAALQPGTLHHQCGRSDLPMNRRRTVDGAIVNAPHPQGPVDDSLHLLTLRDARGQLAGVILRLSCHPVASGPQHRITGDFVGGWRQAMTQALGPQVTPVFLQGAGGDMRPRHAADGDRWRKLPLSEMRTIGHDLMTHTLRTLLDAPTRTLDELILAGHVASATMACEPRYTTLQAVEPLLASPHYLTSAYARHVTDLLRRGQPVPTQASLPVQTLWLDDQLALVGLNCEPLIGLAAILENAFTPRQALVLGYTNGCLCYAPDSTELARGGYEAQSYLMEPWSGPWRHGFETAMLPCLATRPKGVRELT
jgi:hypothetical protein